MLFSCCKTYCVGSCRGIKSHPGKVIDVWRIIRIVRNVDFSTDVFWWCSRWSEFSRRARVIGIDETETGRSWRDDIEDEPHLIEPRADVEREPTTWDITFINLCPKLLWDKWPCPWFNPLHFRKIQKRLLEQSEQFGLLNIWSRARIMF